MYYILTEKQTDRLNDLLYKYTFMFDYEEEYSSIFSVEMLDGYLTAIISSPEFVEPEMWLHFIWGLDPKYQPNWETEADHTDFLELSLKQMACVERNIKQKELVLAFDMIDFSMDENPQVEHSNLITEWTIGYAYGARIAGYATAPEVFVQMGIIDPDSSSYAPDTYNVFEHAKSVTNAVKEIYHYFNKQQTVINPNVKLGRNDPCSCGSGKKYKQCCLK